MIDETGLMLDLCRELRMRMGQVLDCVDIRTAGDEWIYLELRCWLNGSLFKTLCKLVKKLGGMRLGGREFRIPMVLPDEKKSDVGDDSSDKSPGSLLQFF